VAPPLLTAALRAPILELVARRRFAEAARLLEPLIALGEPHPVMRAAFAACLAETNEPERATALLEELERELEHRPPSPGTRALADALKGIRDRLPGGRWHSSSGPYDFRETSKH
jgi:hypothetical protein